MVAVHVAFLYVLISHESFTYVSPAIVRVSFSAPNASQKCGAFLFVGRYGYGIPAQDLDTSIAYTEMFLQGRSLVRISREMGI